MKRIKTLLTATAIIGATLTAPAMAKPLKIIDDIKSITVQTEEGPFEITRERTEAAMITGVLQPMNPIEGVTTIGEVELLEIMQNPEGWVILDMRVKKHFDKGAIPMAENLPFGAAEGAASSYADKNIVSYCYGANCPSAVRGMEALIRGGIKPEKIHYYRGGVVSWNTLGLPLVTK